MHYATHGVIAHHCAFCNERFSQVNQVGCNERPALFKPHISDHTPLAAHHRTTRCNCIWSYHVIASGFQSLWVNKVLREEYKEYKSGQS